MFDKKRVSLFFLAVVGFMFAVQFAGMVVAQSAQSQSVAGDFFKNIWDSWKTGGNFPEGFAKLMITIIIIILVYSTLDFFPGFKGDEKLGVRALLALIVGFLGGAYLLPGEVFVILTSYSAMGFALGFVLPFLILLVFTWKIIEEEPFNNDYLSKMIIVLIWGSWTVYLLTRIASLYGGLSKIFSGAGAEIQSGVSSVSLTNYWILIIASCFILLLIIFAYRKIRRMARKGKLDSETGKTGDDVKAARAAVSHLAKFEEGEVARFN